MPAPPITGSGAFIVMAEPPAWLTAVSMPCRFSVVSLQDNTGMIEWVYHTETFRSCVTHAYNAHGLHPEKQHGSFQDLYSKHPKVGAG